MYHTHWRYCRTFNSPLCPGPFQNAQAQTYPQTYYGCNPPPYSIPGCLPPNQTGAQAQTFLTFNAPCTNTVITNPAECGPIGAQAHGTMVPSSPMVCPPSVGCNNPYGGVQAQEGFRPTSRRDCRTESRLCPPTPTVDCANPYGAAQAQQVYHPTVPGWCSPSIGCHDPKQGAEAQNAARYTDPAICYTKVSPRCQTYHIC